MLKIFSCIEITTRRPNMKSVRGTVLKTITRRPDMRSWKGALPVLKNFEGIRNAMAKK
jgi:hypothetical protein